MYAMDGAGVGDADQRLKPKQKIKHLNVKNPMQVSPLPSRLPSPVGRPQPTEPRVHRRGAPRVEHIQPTVKYFLFAFNLFFWIGGMMVMGAGVWIILDKSGEIRDVLDIVFDPAILIVTAGCVLFVLAFFGCIGSLRENNLLLKLYYNGLLCIMVAEFLMVFITTVIYTVPSLRRKLRYFNPSPVLKTAIIRYQDDENMRDMIDAVQRKFKCCGYSYSGEGYKDWGENAYFNCSKHNKSVSRCGVPHSCCKPIGNRYQNVMCGYNVIGENTVTLSKRIYIQGCLRGFGKWLELHVTVVGAMFLVILVPEVMAVRMAQQLTLQIGKQRLQW